VAHGRSRCDGCGRALGPLDLVPLLSWLSLRGRCRACGARIDPTHPLVELCCAAIGVAAFIQAPLASGAGFIQAPLASGAAMALALFGWQLLLLGWLDARHIWLPRSLSLLLLASGIALGGLAMAALGIDAPLADRLIGAAVGGGGLWLIAALYRRWRGREGLGGGDAPFLAGVGAWTGWQALPFILLLAACAGIGVALLRGLRADAPLPFGTLVALAVPPALLCLPLLLR
jgi:leader peptidase (prepilin peptidase)/N-methyltransferase